MDINLFPKRLLFEVLNLLSPVVSALTKEAKEGQSLLGRVQMALLTCRFNDKIQDYQSTKFQELKDKSLGQSLEYVLQQLGGAKLAELKMLYANLKLIHSVEAGSFNLDRFDVNDYLFLQVDQDLGPQINSREKDIHLDRLALLFEELSTDDQFEKKSKLSKEDLDSMLNKAQSISKTGRSKGQLRLWLTVFKEHGKFTMLFNHQDKLFKKTVFSNGQVEVTQNLKCQITENVLAVYRRWPFKKQRWVEKSDLPSALRAMVDEQLLLTQLQRKFELIIEEQENYLELEKRLFNSIFSYKVITNRTLSKQILIRQLMEEEKISLGTSDKFYAKNKVKRDHNDHLEMQFMESRNSRFRVLVIVEKVRKQILSQGGKGDPKLIGQLLHSIILYLKEEKLGEDFVKKCLKVCTQRGITSEQIKFIEWNYFSILRQFSIDPEQFMSDSKRNLSQANVLPKSQAIPFMQKLIESQRAFMN